MGGRREWNGWEGRVLSPASSVNSVIRFSDHNPLSLPLASASALLQPICSHNMSMLVRRGE